MRVSPHGRRFASRDPREYQKKQKKPDATHSAFHLLPRVRRNRTIASKATCFKNSFIPIAINILNSEHSRGEGGGGGLNHGHCVCLNVFLPTRINTLCPNGTWTSWTDNKSHQLGCVFIKRIGIRITIRITKTGGDG